MRIAAPCTPTAPAGDDTLFAAQYYDRSKTTLSTADRQRVASLYGHTVELAGAAAGARARPPPPEEAPWAAEEAPSI